MLCKWKHRIKGIYPELAPRKLKITLRIGRVETYGNSVQNASAKIRRCVPFEIQIWKAVRVHPCLYMRLHTFDITKKLLEDFQSHRRFTEAAENNLFHVFPWYSAKLTLNKLCRRLLFKPEWMLLCHFFHCTEAECACTGASVCKIYINAAFPFGMTPQALLNGNIFSAFVNGIDNHISFFFPNKLIWFVSVLVFQKHQHFSAVPK